MINTEKLRAAVKHFEFYSKPTNADGSAQCTVADAQKIIRNISRLMTELIEELENQN